MGMHQGMDFKFMFNISLQNPVKMTILCFHLTMRCIILTACNIKDEELRLENTCIRH